VFPKVILYTKFEHFGIIRFALCCGQTNKQTDSKIQRTHLGDWSKQWAHWATVVARQPIQVEWMTSRAGDAQVEMSDVQSLMARSHMLHRITPLTCINKINNIHGLHILTPKTTRPAARHSCLLASLAFYLINTTLLSRRNICFGLLALLFLVFFLIIRFYLII